MTKRHKKCACLEDAIAFRASMSIEGDVHNDQPQANAGEAVEADA